MVGACVELECCGNTIECEDEGREIGVDTGDEALDATETEPSFEGFCLKSSFSDKLWTLSGLACLVSPYRNWATSTSLSEMET